jgi:hypothetical protein
VDVAVVRLRQALSDAFTTGSSIMPQKRNPDAAELVRGKTGRILGSFVALVTVMKGLALAYAKDLQEDKEAVFSAADALDLSIAAMAGMVDDLKAERRRDAPRRGSGLSDRDRSGRLGRAPVGQAVPRGASHRGRHREARRGAGRVARQSAARAKCRKSSLRSPRRCTMC